jgi:hypothetical protein
MLALGTYYKRFKRIKFWLYSSGLFIGGRVVGFIACLFV